MKTLKNYKEFINENNNFNIDELLLNIKKHLVISENYLDETDFINSGDDLENAWIEYVDGQDIGDCQGIVSDIVRKFPICKKVFGEIKIEEPYIDEDGEEQYLMTHHWITINDIIYEFSKGTLQNYISFDDLYSVNCEDESIYE
jgi:hypothetical protein